MTARTPESLGTEPRAFLRSNGTLHHNNGSAVEGDLALYDALQVGRFIDAAVSRARAAWMADGYSWGLACTHVMGGLPCDNPQPHKGGGLGCTHTGRAASDRHDDTEARQD